MTPKEAYHKASALGKRIPELEGIIIKDVLYSYRYALYVIKGRFILAEQTISKNAYYSYLYATYVIEGRWELAEPIISKDAFYSYCYARDVIKGKLPDFMHNQMILNNNNNNNNNTYTKKYIEFIK